MESLPSGWSRKESRSRPGTFYYINQLTGETQWELPTESAQGGAQRVTVAHLLKKHRESRRPASWRCPNITISKEEAIEQLARLREQIAAEGAAHGFDAMRRLFNQLASEESDCGSAQNGGEMNAFGPGEMQRPFEEASFALNVGELSDIVSTDSGVHIILRLA